jgi:hypothetical protein
MAEKVAIFGALRLHINFVNLFPVPDDVPGPEALVPLRQTQILTETIAALSCYCRRMALTRRVTRSMMTTQLGGNSAGDSLTGIARRICRQVSILCRCRRQDMPEQAANEGEANAQIDPLARKRVSKIV